MKSNSTIETPSRKGMQAIGVGLAIFGLAHFLAPAAPMTAAGGTQVSAIRGIPAPAQMASVAENTTFVVPSNSVYVVTGIIATANWSDASPVVIRVDGVDVFKRPVYAGEVIDMPPGLTFGPGETVEIDRLSAAPDSRVTLLGYVQQGR